MQMNKLMRRASIGLGAAFGLALFASAQAQNAPGGGGGGGAPPSPSKVALENRKAAYTLIGNSFRWFGAAVKGNVAYDDVEAVKRAQRITFLSSIPGESFPDASNVGEPDSKAKSDVWSNRADFDKKLHDFQDHSAAFVEVVQKEKGLTEPVKTAIANLGQDCKGCHDTYRVK